jgi:hypothetical protein
MSGGNLGTLSAILGHSTTWVTEHYAHLVPGRFSPEDYERLSGAVGSQYATGKRSTRTHKTVKPKR